MHDRITLGGAASLAVLMIALFAWLRDDVRDNRERLARIETGLAAQHADLTAQGRRLDGIENAQAALQAEQTTVRERLARIDGELSGLAKWLQGIFVFGAPRQNALRAPPADPGADAQSR